MKKQRLCTNIGWLVGWLVIILSSSSAAAIPWLPKLPANKAEPKPKLSIYETSYCTGSTKLTKCTKLGACQISSCPAGTFCISPATGVVPTAQCVAPTSVSLSCADLKNVKTTLTINKKTASLTDPCPVTTPYCLNGACIALPPGCNDSDFSQVVNGPTGPELHPTDKSMWKAGEVGIGGPPAPDVCKTVQILSEQICYKGKPTSFAINCWNLGGECQVNKCISPEGPGEGDVCPEVPGFQTEHLFDTNEDGTKDSCTPKDLCPAVAGIQVTYLFDTNNDGAPDSCTPLDLCPQMSGIQKDYPYDTDNDGKPDSCQPKEEDKCTNKVADAGEEGTDCGGNCPKPCEGPGPEVCSDPDPKKTYPDAAVWGLAGKWHIDQCTGKDLVKHTVCLEDGSIAVDITPCPTGYACKKGLCGESICTETDGGKDLFTKGTTAGKNTKGNAFSYTDNCTAGGGVQEFWCEAEGYTYGDVPCPGGYFCKDGTCIKGGEGGGGQVTSCSEDDGGSNINKKGTVKITANGEVVQTKLDDCGSCDEVLEFFCQGGTYGYGYFPCPKGTSCNNGACLPDTGPTSCVDSDGGEDLTVKGLVSVTSASGGKETRLDQCSSETEVLEYTCCNPEGWQYEFWQCPTGTKCSNGACAAAPCADSDPGNDAFTLGQVVDTNGKTHPDYCVGSAVEQVDCAADGSVKSAGKTPCAKGCGAGVCTK